MPAANAKNLAAWLNIEPAQAKEIAKKIKAAGRGRSADAALEYANSVIHAHGLEAVRGETWISGYYGDIVAVYVNTGDMYNGTLIYETATGRYLVWTLGDWVEKNQRKYNII